MKKTLLLLLVMALGVSQMFSAPVDLSMARKAGESFAQANFKTSFRSDALRLVVTKDAYYVFNVGDNGFVIVSSDDCFRPVIGYSDEGVFDAENPSPEMMYYLDRLGQGREIALNAKIRQEEQVAAEWAALLGNQRVSPKGSHSFYLVQTKWNQNSPYNKFCPKAEGEGRAYAGCVATAMSQVMNYWKYPTHGYGNHTYTHYQYGELSADFSSAEYDFSLMPNSINDMSPVENIDAIATFMYHCGIAVDMSYGSDGSGAMSEDVPGAVLRYFGYSNRCRMLYRDDYSLEEFQAILKDQFDRGWPCYYSGQDVDGSGGHAFVCDGYDDNDMFHFNWGWSGSGDGFFVIDGLDVSSYAFNDDQGVVTNFVPADVFVNTSKAPNNFTAVPNGDDRFSVTLSWVNPTASLDGHPIDAIDQIVLMRDGVVIETIQNPAVGEAVTYVDVAGQPILVNYSIYAVCHGVIGRSAYAKGVNLGPTCDWTLNLSCDDDGGWGNGKLAIVNAAGVMVGEFGVEEKEAAWQVEMPQGRISFQWTAPSDTLDIGIEVLDADGQQVFVYSGPSSMMPHGTFYQMVNTCGGAGSFEHPFGLTAETNDNDVILNWIGVSDAGYGYNIYRDGKLYSMVTDATTYTDENTALALHDYFVTAFCREGETDPSNTVSAIVDNDEAPRNLDYEILANRAVLKWEEPVNVEDLVGYAVYRRTIGEEYKRIKLCSASANTYTDKSSTPDGQWYYYKVVAVHRRDNVESLPARSLKHPELPYVMVNRTIIPNGLAIQEQEENQLLLQWEPAWVAESYNLYCNGELVAQDIEETQYVDVVRDDALMYQVTGVVNGVESSPSNKVYYGNYAVGEAGSASVMVFPNPTKGIVSVKAEELQEVLVYDMAGQLIMRRVADCEEMTIDLSGKGAGVYFLGVKTSNGYRVNRIVLM